MVRKVRIKKKKYSFKIGLLLITISIILPIIKKTEEIFFVKVKAKEINAFIDNTKKDNQENTNNKEYIYQAIIEIPDINLKEGLLPYDSKYNDVKYHIQLLTNTMPDIKNSNLILASHSGTSKVAYFNDLDKLSLNSPIIIYYQGYKYTYTLDNYYSVLKNGSVNIIRNKYKNTITLITCSNNDDTKQIVYIGYLKDKTTY